jgi:hypothetical protein
MFYSTTTTSLQSTPVADDVIETQDSHHDAMLEPERNGKPIAKGSIVSSFQGGLVAVRVDDDLTNDQQEEEQQPEIIDTTKSLPKSAASKKKSSSNTLGTCRYIL